MFFAKPFLGKVLAEVLHSETLPLEGGSAQQQSFFGIIRYFIRKCITPAVRVGLKAGLPIYKRPALRSTEQLPILRLSFGIFK
jgi:hypothetical protein